MIFQGLSLRQYQVAMIKINYIHSSPRIPLPHLCVDLRYIMIELLSVPPKFHVGLSYDMVIPTRL